jgi:hypothetical protein
MSLIAQEDRKNPMQGLKVSLVAIQVSNLDSSINWYKKNLNFKLRDKKEFPDHGLKMAFLTLNDFELELIENNKSIDHDELLKDYPKGTEIQGFAKLSFTVKDIDSANSFLKANENIFLYDLRKSNDPKRSDRKWLIITDIDGNWIQLFSE